MLAIVGAALFPAHAAAQAGGGKPKVALAGGVIYASHLIPAGATVRFQVACPKPFIVSTGTVSSADPKVLLLLSKPFAGGNVRWDFAFRNSDTQDQIVTVAVTCVPLPPIFVPPGKPLKGAKVVVVPGAGGVKKIKFTCPKGQVPLGVGQESTSDKRVPYSAGSIGGVQVTSVEATGRAITLGLRNPGPSVQRVSGGARCFEKQEGDRRLQLNRFTSTRQVSANGSVVSGGCPGAMPLLAGFVLPTDGSLQFIGAGFSKGPFSVSWAFDNNSNSSAQAQVQLLCSVGRLKFVRGLPPGSTGINTVVGPITIIG